MLQTRLKKSNSFFGYFRISDCQKCKQITFFVFFFLPRDIKSNNMQIFSNFVFVFQEMDSIVDQMMTVAEYIGWETKELRPVKFYVFHSNMHSELV